MQCSAAQSNRHTLFLSIFSILNSKYTDSVCCIFAYSCVLAWSLYRHAIDLVHTCLSHPPIFLLQPTIFVRSVLYNMIYITTVISISIFNLRWLYRFLFPSSFSSIFLPVHTRQLSSLIFLFYYRLTNYLPNRIYAYHDTTDIMQPTSWTYTVSLVCNTEIQKSFHFLFLHEAVIMFLLIDDVS